MWPLVGQIYVVCLHFKRLDSHIFRNMKTLWEAALAAELSTATPTLTTTTLKNMVLASLGLVTLIKFKTYPAVNKSAASEASLDGPGSCDQVGCERSHPDHNKSSKQ